MTPNTKPVIFTHIPKTGGVTIQKIIDRKYFLVKRKSFRSYNVRQIGLFRSLSEIKKRQLILITGHLYFGIHRELGREARYFTMLRNPIDRAISEYNFINSYKYHSFHKEMSDQQYSLETFIKSGKVLNMDNCQVRYLCGVQDIPYGGVTEQHLQLAIENLSKYYEVIGIMEFFDESLLLFAKTFGWSTPFYTRQNVNKSEKKTSLANLDSSTRELLEYSNRFDTILYQEALELFNKQVISANACIREDVALFKKQNHRKHHLTALITMISDYINQLKLHKLKRI